MGNVNETLARAIVGMPSIFEVVAVGATSAASTSALSMGTSYLFTATAACHIVFAASPTATTSHTYLPANYPLVITMPSDGLKVATIRSSGDGNLYISSLAPAHRLGA